MAVVLSITIFWKLKVVSKNKSSVASAAGSTSNKYAKANRTSTGILMSSLLFITLPSVCVGVVELSGFSIFKLIGPFYSACLMVSGKLYFEMSLNLLKLNFLGCCNGIIFITSNWENVRPKKKVSSIIVKKISTAHTQSGLAWH